MKRQPETKLEALLQRRGLTQKQLRDLILQKTGHEIAQTNISKVVSKKIEVNITTAMIIAHSLGVTVDEVNNLGISDIVRPEFLLQNEEKK